MRAAPKTDAPAAIAEKPESKAPAPTQVASIAPVVAAETKPVAAAAPSPEKAAPPPLAKAAASASPLETNGSRIRAEVSPPSNVPAATKVAVLPAQPVQNDDNDVTGSIPPPDRTATIPVGIGEASSTELMVDAATPTAAGVEAPGSPPRAR